MNIKEPFKDGACTSCHAPLQEVPDSARGERFSVSEGVSCESCHGPAEGWLRSHTRADWSHADRVSAGMRDLKNLYVRANVCVSCHQTVATRLLTAGHPELTFELDGQGVSQPKHWRETTNWNGAQAWLVGQAVALRELSWQLSRESDSENKLAARWSALLWLLQRLDEINPEFFALRNLSIETTPDHQLATLKASDQLAKRAAETPCNREMSRRMLEALAGTGSEFQSKDIPAAVQACRAERLVLALDRLVVAQKPPPSTNDVDPALNHLFSLIQSRQEFSATEFAAALKRFSKSLSK